MPYSFMSQRAPFDAALDVNTSASRAPKFLPTFWVFVLARRGEFFQLLRHHTNAPSDHNRSRRLSSASATHSRDVQPLVTRTRRWRRPLFYFSCSRGCGAPAGSRSLYGLWPKQSQSSRHFLCSPTRSAAPCCCCCRWKKREKLQVDPRNMCKIWQKIESYCICV